MVEAISWRDFILRELLPPVTPLTLAADPDCLLTEEGILQNLRDQGYEVLVFQDPIEFRFNYESQYRDRLHQAEPQYLIVTLQKASQSLQNLPYDLVKAGRQLTISLANLFPNLSYTVVKQLDLNCLDRLYQETSRLSRRLGDNGTKNFVLKHVFEITSDAIQNEVDLLRLLLQRHYRNQQFPSILDEHLIQQFRQNNRFQHIPLEKVISDREAFFEFLQSQWLHFIQTRIPKARLTAELAGQYGSFPHIDLSLEHEDIRVYIDNLFLEGHLKTIAAHDLNLSSIDLQPVPWITAGISVNPEVEQEQRLIKLIHHLSDSLPTSEVSHQAWLSLAPRWAELLVLRSQSSTSVQSKHEPSFVQLQQQVDTAFLDWVQLHYRGLFNQAATVMLHHIPRLMMRQLESAQKVALLVLDGMALDQWIILRNVVQATNPSLKFQESAVFAWLPTITSVSRQALFSGKSPSSFPSSINSTHKEEALWCQFWVDQGIGKSAIAYAKSLGEEGSLSIVEDLLTRPKLRVLGLVVNSIDERMHHAMDGITGLHKQVAHWAEMEFIQNMINLLLRQNFTIFLTSDHGNIEAVGIGSPSERAIADLRGERVRVYNNETLKQQVKEKFPDVFDWTPNGLPKDYLPLFAPGRAAFVSKGEKIVGHGGLSIEELIVPLIQIRRSNS